MGDYNIDLKLNDDSDRPTHDCLDLIYLYCMIPTILKPTRITEMSATIIDNILTNCDNEVTTAILVTDITDHLPTILVNKTKIVNAKNKLNNDFWVPIHMFHIMHIWQSALWYQCGVLFEAKYQYIPLMD